ncbi:MAG: hypothetical protein E4G91_01360 [Candidatus Zixiibacteriota bacterium]|nr:MAG: hypothetical protein E4G91_01360 [candidate division Zixibacteria bacterium]
MSGSPLAFDFDFTNLIISGKVSGSYAVENDLYSDWKELVVTNADGIAAGAPPAFVESIAGTLHSGGSIGGNDLGGGQQIAPYFFINNQGGWRFRPAEENGETTLTGNFFPLTPATPFIIPTAGGFTQLVKIVVSPQAIVVTPVGTGLTASESLILKEIHALVAGDAEVSLDDLTVTIYDTTVSPRVILAVYSISADSRIRTRTT